MGVAWLGVAAPAGAQSVQDSQSAYDEGLAVTASNETSVSLSSSSDLDKAVEIAGEIVVTGEAAPARRADAGADSIQINRDSVMDTGDAVVPEDGSVTNSVEVGGNVLESAEGNIALNASAGFSNLQGNTLSLSALGIGSGSAGAADAAVMSHQETARNHVASVAANDTTALLQDVLSGADGNIGVNLGSGAFNAQFNGVSIASVAGLATLADARAATSQLSSANQADRTFATHDAGLGAGVLPGASGNMAVNVASGASNLQTNTLSIAMVE